MSRLSEQDCINAMSGRVIKDIGYMDDNEDTLVIRTHDGLAFEVQAHWAACGGWLKVVAIDE